MRAERFGAPRAQAMIDTAALCSNFCRVRKVAGVRVIAVVKANAYGHGLSLAVPAFLAGGCDFFAVAELCEGEAVRALAPSAEILVLGYTPPEDAARLAAASLTQCVFSLPYAVSLAAAARAAGVTLPVHLKIDGGMCRLGLAPDAGEIGRIFSQEGLCVCGVFTHFPNAAGDPRGTQRAIQRFAALRERLPKGLVFHAAASDALPLESARFDGVRIGLALYGYGTQRALLSLAPALSLQAPVVQIHTVPRGTPVGYGGRFVTARRSRIGTLPIGYADGLSTACAGMPVTLLHAGVRFQAPLCGRICMDHSMIDLTDTPGMVGDNICLVEDAERVARYTNGIPYEVLTAIGTRVRRQQKGEGR